MNTPLRIRRIALLGMAGVMAGSLVGTSLVAHAQEAEPPTVTVEDDIQNALGLGAEAEGHASPLPRRILTLWRIIPHFKPFDQFLYSEYRFKNKEDVTKTLAAIPGVVTNVSVSGGILEITPNDTEDPTIPSVWTFDPANLNPHLLKILERIEHALNPPVVSAEEGEEDPVTVVPEVPTIKLVVVDLNGELKAVIPAKGFHRPYGGDGDGIPRPLLKRFNNFDRESDEGIDGKLRGLRNRLENGRGPLVPGEDGRPRLDRPGRPDGQDGRRQLDRPGRPQIGQNGIPDVSSELQARIQEIRGQLANGTDLSDDERTALRQALMDLFKQVREERVAAAQGIREQAQSRQQQLRDHFQELRDQQSDGEADENEAEETGSEETDA